MTVSSKTASLRIDCVVGTRPNFVKMAPILRALRDSPGFSVRLLHTGQHYDHAVDGVFFEELRLPAPDVHLRADPAAGSRQLAEIMLALDTALKADRPDLLLVVGDVTSTLAAALAASQLSIPLAHVEAGLRSFDRAMPEERNRILVDQLSDLLFVTERSGLDNLAAERIAGAVHFVGNVMIDTLFASRPRALPPRAVFTEAGAGAAFSAAVEARGFGFVTLHRPSNVDEAEKLAGLIAALRAVSARLPLVFAVHPRTAAAIARFGLGSALEAPLLLTTGPLSYLRTLGLTQNAAVIVTDSGGLQEEATALGTPCITVRDNTERPSTLEAGHNRLASAATLAQAVAAVLEAPRAAPAPPPLWDGQAAHRIADAIAAWHTAR